MTEFDMVPSCVTFSDNRLCYSGQRCHRIPETLAKLYGPKVHSFDLSYNELISLRGLEGFPLLRELVLDNNQLTDTLVFPHLPHLHTLSINKNHINDIDFLVTKISLNFPCLTYLSLLGNKACPNQLSGLDNDDEDYQRYRYYVLHHLPNLDFLDSSRVSQRERAEARRRGQLMKVVRPKTEPTDAMTDATDTGVSGDEDSDSGGGGISRRLLPVALRRHYRQNTRQDQSQQQEVDEMVRAGYTPLPKGERKPEDHRGAYTRCKYKYSGKNSEGNRFISNNDL